MQSLWNWKVYHYKNFSGWDKWNCTVGSIFVKFPDTMLAAAEAVKSFQEFTDCKIPQVCGAIDGTHIEIISPSSESKLDYFSGKQKFTINTQAVVGSYLIFFDVFTGVPGSFHDARMLRSSTLYQKCESNELTRPMRVIDGIQVQPLLLGDGAYPSTNWLVKPYSNNICLTDTQKNSIKCYLVAG